MNQSLGSYPVAMTYGSGATGTYFGYDVMGRPAQQFQLTGSTPTKYKLSYNYNFAGELTSETYPSGRVVSQSFDAAGRLSQVSDASTTFANSFQYAAHGGLTSETWGNTAVHAMSYNRSLQPSQAKITLGSTVPQQYDYSYGQFNTSTGAVDTSKNNGQIGRIDSAINGTAQWNQGFSYDELGRLSNIVEHQGSSNSPPSTFTQTYGYDRYGNRNQSANSTLGLAAVASTDYSASTNRFGSSLATYDAAGNITADSKFRGFSYSYDANGRQTSATNGTWTEYQTYDCLGQRVQTSVGAYTRTMVYDVFGQSIADYIGSGSSTLERENIYRGGILLATYEASPSQIRYAVVDIQGSTRGLMNNSGSSSAVIARYDFLPFGEDIASNIGPRSSDPVYGTTNSNRIKYGLTERDDQTSLDHTKWRKYENFSGRWTSPDPLESADPRETNAYVYAQNDPVNFIDPAGLMADYLCENYGLCGAGGYGADRGWASIAPGFWGAGDLNNRAHGHENPLDTRNCPPGHICFKEPIGDSLYRLHDFGPIDPFLGYQEKRDPNEKAVNTTVGACSAVATYASPLNSSKTAWRGLNGKWNRIGWGGNQYTGARSLALRTAGAFRTLSVTTAVIGAVLSGANAISAYRQGDNAAAAKNSLDGGMAIYGAFGSRTGAAISTAYFIGDAIGWNRIGSELKRCGPECQYRTQNCTMASK